MRALSIRIRASALSPAKARQTWLSTRPILEGVIRVSWSFMAERFSQPRTTMDLPFTPTAQVPECGILECHVGSLIGFCVGV